jgi:hypothetical protein
LYKAVQEYRKKKLEKTVHFRHNSQNAAKLLQKQHSTIPFSKLADEYYN